MLCFWLFNMFSPSFWWNIENSVHPLACRHLWFHQQSSSVLVDQSSAVYQQRSPGNVQMVLLLSSFCLSYCADHSRFLDFGGLFWASRATWRQTGTMFDFSWRPSSIVWGANGCRPSEQSHASPSLHASGVFVCPFARSVSALAPGEAHGRRPEERRQGHVLRQQPAEVGQADAQQP